MKKKQNSETITHVRTSVCGALLLGDKGAAEYKNVLARDPCRV